MTDTYQVSSTTDGTSPRADSPVREALDRFKLANEAEAAQRTRELEDLQFVDDPDGQWPDDIRNQRKGGAIGQFITPARPCLTFDGVTPAIDQVTNQARNAHLAVQLKPKGSAANQDTAEMLKGLYRSIEVDSNAHVARMWALERAAKCGRGYYRILKEYANDGDFDLDLTIKRVLNQHSVYLDPFHQEPDGSDADWAFIVEDMPLSKFRRLYPKSTLASYDDSELTGLGVDEPEWMQGDGEATTVRVAEYFCRHWTQQTLELRSDGQKGLRSDLGPLAKGVTVINSRDVDVPTVQWQTINCLEVLDEQEWEGRYIPIVQVIGVETNVNGDRRFRGIVQKAKDAQRSKNYMRSKEIETIGLASYVPWLIPEGVIEGYEKIWQKAATANFPYLPYKEKNLGGHISSPPQRNAAEPPIQAIVLAAQQADADLQRATQTFDPSLGQSQGPNQSGKAITALQQQAEHGKSNYLENLAQISMAHEARIVVGLMPYVYDRPGRIARILGEDGSPSSVMLNHPFVPGADGQPQPVQPGQPPPHGSPAPQHFAITKEAEYSVVVQVGKSFSTQREEATAMMGQLAEAAPQMVPFYADLWVRSMDFPGKDEIADRLKKMLPPQLQQGEDGQPAVDPAQAQAQIQQLQMQLQQAMQELQQAKSGIAQAQIKAQSDQQITAAKIQSEQQIAQMKADIERLKAILSTQVKQHEIDSGNAQAVLQAQQAAQAHQADLQAAEQSQAREHLQSAISQRSDQMHATQSQQTDHAHAAVSQRADQQHATKLVKLAPKPTKAK